MQQPTLTPHHSMSSGHSDGLVIPQAMRVNPLSMPKGAKYQCEICSKPAHLQCSACRVTFYCSDEHQIFDGKGIHATVCSQLQFIRSPPPTIGLEAERKRHKQQILETQKSLIAFTRDEATKFLKRNQYEMAFPPARLLIKLSCKVYGNESIELVPSYLLLAEATLGMGQLDQTEEYLSLANWSMIQNPDCPYEIRAQLHENFGRLYADQQRYDEALQRLANAVYHSTLMYGTMHIRVATGLFLMATVFVAQNRMGAATSFFVKVVHIWQKRLLILLFGEQDEPTSDPLTEAEIAEGTNLMSTILAHRIQYSTDEQDAAIAESHHVIALIHLLTENYEEAMQSIESALEITQELGADHALSRMIRSTKMRIEQTLYHSPNTARNSSKSNTPRFGFEPLNTFKK